MMEIDLSANEDLIRSAIKIPQQLDSLYYTHIITDLLQVFAWHYSL